MSEREKSEDAIIRVRLNAMESEAAKWVAEEVMGLETRYDDGYVIKVGDRETQRELEEKIYDKARDRGNSGDLQGGQWYKDAAFKIGDADLELPADSDYEYRVTGCGGGQWRRSDWMNYDEALEGYETACDEWDGVVGFERREPGDDSTIQRKKSPNDGEWMDVTEDMIHFKDEEVAA